MKLSAILLLPGAASFAPPAACRLGRECPAELFQQPPARLTEADLMDKSRVNSLSALDGEDDDAPRLFSRSIYDDFQSSLLLLEKRLSDGPITAEEYGRLDAETGRIVREMNEYLADPAGCRERIERGYEAEAGAAVPEAKSPGVLDAGGAAVAAASKVAQADRPPPPSPAEAVTPAEEPPAAAEAANSIPMEQEDLDRESIKGGFGLAAGTTNTYIIPGMNEMSPEEYRDRLQESISARQAARREAAKRSGIIGNRSSNGYLDGLSRPQNGGSDKA